LTPDGRTPVMVVTGFLGSGKTTLVNRLLAQQQDSLVIVNEFGEVPVDHDLIENAQERTVALPNGCLCCHLRGDLEDALIGAAMRRRRGEIAGFDRVIVETSGIADPGPVAQTLFADQALARDFKLGPIITVVDAADAGGRAASPEVARAQIAAADVVVLSKTDRTRDASSAENEVAGINPQARRIFAQFGDVEAAMLEKSGSEPDFSEQVKHSSAIRSFVLRFDQPVRRELLEHFLATLVELRGADLLRVKGAVPVEGSGLMLVQGVRHVFDRLRPARGGQAALVFIANGIEKNEVQSLWNAMSKLKGHP
jgi:G3E family GTPase